MLQPEGNGLRIDNSKNQPLSVHFRQPLRGDFHVVAFVDVLTRSLEGRTQGLLVYTDVSAGFVESGKNQMMGFGMMKRADESVVRSRFDTRAWPTRHAVGRTRRRRFESSGRRLDRLPVETGRRHRARQGHACRRGRTRCARDGAAGDGGGGGPPDDGTPPAAAKTKPAGAAAAAADPAAGGEIEKREIPFPAPFTEVVAGGGGDYLIFYLPSLDKLAVLDVKQRQLARFLSMSGGMWRLPPARTS